MKLKILKVETEESGGAKISITLPILFLLLINTTKNEF
jgi:hypothetical protein